ncbi:MAG: CRISPR system precrRNA processing endoribonuclease RAMP protein Cas6 [Anaerolineae bacterium]|nr:CRISPR system precrRNA processing endoribonuclease RAMP protein Cas6 [Anaerolineae bacterium]
MRVEFLTPTHLKDGKRLVTHAPPFRVLFQRLMERLLALSTAFSESPLDGALKYEAVGLSDGVRLVADGTRLVHLESPSSRLGSVTSISGLVGYAVYDAADWAPFWPWLKWGELTHVGKNTVKGEGMIRVLSEER